MGNWGEKLSETSWKWRYKVKNLGKPSEKTLADYNTNSSSDSRNRDDEVEISPRIKGIDGNDTAIGSHPCVKTFYEGPGSTDYRKKWVDYPPKQLSKSAMKAQDRVAIRLFKSKDLEKPVVKNRYSLKCSIIEVQNLNLVAALEPILKKEDLNLDLSSPAHFKAPFRPLYFCYDEIVAKCKILSQNDTLKPFMLLLIKVLDDVFKEVRLKKQSLLKSGLISFNTAWTYYFNNAPVLSRGPNYEVLSKVVSTNYTTKCGKSSLQIKARVLKFNGEAFVWEDFDLDVPEFEGNKPITDLPHFPLEFHENPQAVKDQMTTRGRMILDYQGLVYCTYDGVALYEEDREVQKYNVDGRILIDLVGYNKHHLAKGKHENNNPKVEANRVAGTGRLPPPDPYDDDPYSDDYSLNLEDEQPLAQNTAAAENGRLLGQNKQRTETKISKGNKRLTEEEQKRNKDAMLGRSEDLKFLAPLLEGFCLKHKKWFQFFVEDIGPIKWNDEAFDHLVYDEVQKDLVLSFVESHGHSNQQQLDDVVMGKGQGLVILLSGPPGTGKTLTAEAVADRTRRPLFYLQAEDLGISASTLGANLKGIFEMATEWDAVILLDEADVFMAERHPQDIVRNELVSIFLRELEYTRSIIFLTTNMYQTVDTAFRSRLSLHLVFKPLGVEARMEIWQKFLARIPSVRSTHTTVLGARAKSSQGGSGAVEINEEDLIELAQWPLNGREIKTVIKMVKLWCDHKGHILTLARLENGIKVTSPHVSKLSTNGDGDLYDD